jgi:ABC-type multidrug transport system ATPase subunit
MLIIANNLTFKTIKKTVVKGVSFACPSGRTIAIYGPEGSGKKVLLLMLGGYLNPSAGSVMADNENIFDDLSRYRQRVGLGEIDEINPLLDKLTARENLRLALELCGLPHGKPDVQTVLDGFGIRTYADTPLGNSTPLARAVTSLAVATLHDPEIIILDEPTKRLTSHQAKRFWEIVNTHCTDKTIIFSTKNYDEAVFNSALVLSLESGRLINT